MGFVDTDDGVVMFGADETAFETRVGIFIGVKGNGRREGEADFQIFNVEFGIEINPCSAVGRPSLTGECDFDTGGDKVACERLKMFADLGDFHDVL
jgi:hypothetical protein